MKNIILLTILLLSSIETFSQLQKLDSTTKSEEKKTTSKKVENKKLLLKENFNQLNHSGEIKLKSESRSIFEFLFPSLIALIVGLMAYWATIRSSKKQNLMIEKQMLANKQAMEDQINSSMKIAELDFRKNVLSVNRQAWINDLRSLMSELISMINVNSVSPDKIKNEDYEKIIFLITKAEFMLNPIKDSDYIGSIVKLKDLLFDISLNKIEYSQLLSELEIVKDKTKETLKKEWERVKKGE